MSKIDDGGPAFPGTQYASGISPSGHSVGMTLRDYFAAKAMGAFIQATADDNVVSPDVALAAVSKMAFMMADAMLAARKSHQPEKQQSAGWTEWNGGECPVPTGASFFIKFRDGDECAAGTGDGLTWNHDGTSGDIIAYRIISNGDPK